MFKTHRQVAMEIREKINTLEYRIKLHENEAQANLDIVNNYERKLSDELPTFETERIKSYIDYYRFAMEKHINKVNLLGERQRGLEIALDILNSRRR